MPELREVFEMATKEVEPEVDMRREQEERQRRLARNRKIGAFAVAAAIGLAAIVLVTNGNDTADGDGGAVPAGEPSAVAPVTEPGFVLYDLATGGMTGTGIDTGGRSAVDVSPDGTKMVYSDSGTGLGATVHVANVDGSDVQEFAGTDAEGDATAPRWSPDGTKIVYQGKPSGREIGNVYVLDVTTGRVHQISDLEPTKASFYYMAPTFSPDGTTVLFMKQDRDDGDDGLRWDLWSVPATGGEPTLVRRSAINPDFSPNGDALAFVEAVSDDEFSFGDLYVAAPDGSGARKVAEGPSEMPRWSPDGSQLAWWSNEAAYVMDVQTGDTQRVPDVDSWVEWVDEDTWMIEVSDY